jgi:6-phosphofructokinase
LLNHLQPYTAVLPLQVDGGGNRKLPPIAPWLKSKINAYFNAMGNPVSLKYIDPSYMIRSVAANPADAVYCTMLAQSAVHGAMAGFTGFSVGLTNNRLVRNAQVTHVSEWQQSHPLACRYICQSRLSLPTAPAV